MMKYRKQLEWAIYILLAIALASPLITRIPFFRSTLGIVTVFQIAVEIAFFIWIPLAFADKKYRVNWRHPVIFSFLAFVLALVVVLPFSVDPQISFWSSTYRATGLIHFIHFTAWLIVAAGMLKTWEQWRAMLLLTTGVALAADVAAIVEWVKADTEAFRVQGFFGNSLYLSHFLTLHLFIAGILGARAKRVWEWYAFIIVALVHVFGILLTVSRSAIIAIGLAGFLAIILLLRSAKGKVKSVYAPMALLLVPGVFIAGFLFVYSQGPEWVHDHLPYSGARIFYPNPDVDSGGILKTQLGDRDNIWRMAGEAVVERPIAGNGMETFRTVFNEKFDPTEKDSDILEVGFDRVHNQFLEVLYGAGIIGFVPYVVFWAAILFYSARSIREEEQRDDGFASAFLFMAFVAHAVNIAFLFDAREATQLWILLGAMGYWLSPEAQWPILKKRFAVPDMNPPKLLIVGLIIVGVLAVYGLNIRPFVGYQFNSSAVEAYSTNPSRAADFFEKAFAHGGPYVYYARLSASNLIRLQIDYYGERSDALERIVEMNIEEGEKSIAAFPNRFVSYQMAALSYIQSARWNPELREEYLSFAYDQGLAITESAPGRVDGYEILGDVEMLRGNFEKAGDWYAMARRNVEKIDNVSTGRFDFRQAEIELRSGDYDKAVLLLFGSTELGYSFFFDIGFVRALNEVGDYENYPEQFDQYIHQLYSVQKSYKKQDWMLLEQSAVYFLNKENDEYYQEIINYMHLINPIAAEQFWWQNRSEVK